jgi:hypothetical protein
VGLSVVVVLLAVLVAGAAGGSVGGAIAAFTEVAPGTTDVVTEPAVVDPTPSELAQVPPTPPVRDGSVEVAQRESKPKPKPKPEPRRSQRSKLADKVEKKVAAPTLDPFEVAMINILGSQHTQGGKGGYGSGTSRAYTATRMLVGRGSSIIGFSEIQTDQLNVFRNNAPGYAVYPGTELGGAGVPQSVAWNTNRWRLVEAHTITIPFSGQQRPQPVVRLADVTTGAEIWVMNVHNSPQGMEGERDQAEAIEVAEINRLAESGIPIVVTGDFNEKQEVLCRITGSTSLVSAVGGGNCYPPPQPMRVDWIFASPAFTQESYVVTREAPVPSITDHAVLYSTLSLR